MAENAQTNETNSTQIDYEAEYNKMVAERDTYKAEAEKQKRMKDQYASENAEYKKKADSQLSEEEKRAKEIQDLIEESKRDKEELAKMKLEKSGLENGFSATEVSKLIDGKFDFKVISDIIATRVDEALKSANASRTKKDTAENLAGNGTAGTDSKSDYQRYQENKKGSSKVVNI